MMDSLTDTIPLEQARPGMVLADAVRLANGSVLLAAGVELGETHLASLRRQEVSEISVVASSGGEASVAAGGQRSISEEEVRAELQRLFRKSESDAATQALIRAVLEYRLEKIK